MSAFFPQAVRLFASIAFAPLTAGLLAAQTPASGSYPPNAGVSIWTQNVTGFRKKHGSVGRYTKKWDLSDLPHYVPRRQLTGTLRIWGNNYIKDGKLADYWSEAFARYQPGLKIKYTLPTGTIAVGALVCGVADLGMFYKATLTDHLTFEQMFHYPVTEVQAVTGSFDVYGWGPATIIVVNQDNPLTQISMKQLDGVFGGARSGGYVGSVWHDEYPYSRGPEENIRTWGQLGLTGEWADKPIHVGGQNLRAGATRSFSDDVLFGSDQFVENYHAVTNYIAKDGSTVMWSVQAHDIVAKDKYALFYVSPMSMGPGIKELAIQGRNGGPYVPRTLETVHDRTYPLTHFCAFYINRKPGQPVDPKVWEFLHVVLSREGQDCVQREGRYLPLTGEMVGEQLKQVD
jgi:phosphate transport system substrate-binding protein